MLSNNSWQNSVISLILKKCTLRKDQGKHRRVQRHKQQMKKIYLTQAGRCHACQEASTNTKHTAAVALSFFFASSKNSRRCTETQRRRSPFFARPSTFPSRRIHYLTAQKRPTHELLSALSGKFNRSGWNFFYRRSRRVVLTDRAMMRHWRSRCKSKYW